LNLFDWRSFVLFKSDSVGIKVRILVERLLREYGGVFLASQLCSSLATTQTRSCSLLLSNFIYADNLYKIIRNNELTPSCRSSATCTITALIAASSKPHFFPLNNLSIMASQFKSL
jgi:hypothetical protein